MGERDSSTFLWKIYYEKLITIFGVCVCVCGGGGGGGWRRGCGRPGQIKAGRLLFDSNNFQLENNKAFELRF